MKKFLFAATTLLSTAALAGAAGAGGLENYPMQAPAADSMAVASPSALSVGVGGSIDFQAGFADQDSAFEVGPNSREGKFQNDTELSVSVDGKADSGLEYGAVIELEADVTADADGEGLNADKTYIYLQNANTGRLELGNVNGAENKLKVDASSFARATGGVDGDWYDFVNTSGALGTASFILGPDLPLDDAAGITEDATKISYYSPRFAGFQLGASYIPDTGNGGTAAGFTSDTSGDFENVFALGANYKQQYDQVGVEASLTGDFGSAENAGTEDLAAWAAGLALNSNGFTVGGSYGDWDDSGQPTVGGGDGNFWDAGIAWAPDNSPFGVSLEYFDSELNNNELNNIILGADYQLAPGLVPYVEVNFFDLDEAGTTTDNDGTVLLVGTELTF